MQASFAYNHEFEVKEHRGGDSEGQAVQSQLEVLGEDCNG